ncbi:ATP-dependent helicase [Patescibacteria group bacterium]
MNSLDSLNSKQKEAAQHKEGPLLILAGAGSGKTKTLTHRVAYLIEQGVIKPWNILAVTFTNKAAGEMRERVQALLDNQKDSKERGPFIGTFHAFCVQVLRREAEAIGYRRDFAIFDSQDQFSLMKQVLKDQGVDVKRYHPQGVLHHVSQAKNELLTPDEVAEKTQSPAEEITAEAYESYQARLFESNALDFDDLIMQTVLLFRKHPAVLEKYQRRFEYLLVDEYQDTNHAQYTLVTQLSEKHRNLAVVGDDWQSIYGWRGANVKNILEFEKDYPDAKVIKLEQNYRSRQRILDAAHVVIEESALKTDKKLWTERGEGEKVQIVEAADEREEARFVLREVERLTMEEAEYFPSLNSCAVLYRTNAQSRALEEACLKMNIPYRLVGGVRFYERKEVKDLIAFLRLMANPRDFICFQRIVNVPVRGIGKVTIGKIKEWAAQNDNDLVMACRMAAESGSLGNKSLPLAKFAALIEQGSKYSEKMFVDKLLEWIIKQIGFERMLRDGSDEGEMRWENVQELMTVAEQHPDLQEFLEEVALMSDQDKVAEGAPALTLMTIHTAKGLEYPAIFVVGMEEGIFPHSRSLFDPAELDEERRLAYVAMTRAKERLYLIYTQQRMLFGNIQSNPPSRFIEDLDDTDFEFIDLTESKKTRHSFSDSNIEVDDSEFMEDGVDVIENPFVAGDRVFHQEFGEGIVGDIDDDVIEVTFAKIGTKKIALGYVPLKKL